MKKGQITIFVVLGITLLIIIGLATFLLNRPSGETELTISEAGEIRNLVRQCLEDVSKEGILLAGKNGGWINPDALDLSNEVIPTRSNYLYYPPSTIPYWYFVDENNNARSLQPPLCKSGNCIINSIGPQSIQQQLESYIIEGMKDCAELSMYEDRVSLSRGELGVYTEFTNENVLVNLLWPHRITKNEVTEEFSEVVVVQDVKFADAYQLANLVTAEERYGTHFSQQTMSMISLYSGLEAPLPPISEVDFSIFGGNKIWVSESVKANVINEILPLMEFFQIKGTKNYQAFDYDSDNEIFEEGIYSGFDITFSEPTTEDYAEGMEARFTLAQTPAEISINNGASIIRGEELSKASGIIMKLLGLGITRYGTVYSISYPIIFTAEDTEAFDGEGFQFSTAFEVNIRNNEPGSFDFKETELEDFVSGTSGISLLNRDPNAFTITLSDAYDYRIPISDTAVSYICAEEYYLGRTEADGKLVVNMPYCELGGTISVFHPGYEEKTVAYNHDGSKREIDIEMWQIKQKEAKLTKRTTDYLLYNSLSLPPITELNPDTEYAFLILEPLDHTWPGPQVITVGDSSSISNTLANTRFEDEFLEGFEGFEISDDLKVDLNNNSIYVVPGRYSIRAVIIHTVPFTLPEAEKGGILGTKIGSTKFPETTFEVWPKGGMYYPEFTFSEEMVYQDNSWNFVMQEIKPPRSWRELSPDEESEIKTWDENQQSEIVVDILKE